MRAMKLTHVNRMIMPLVETVFDKKGLFKHCVGNNSTMMSTAGAGSNAKNQHTAIVTSNEIEVPPPLTKPLNATAATVT